MPRFKGIILYQNIPKIKLFLQKNAKFSSAGDSPPRPPKPPPPHCEFLATRLHQPSGNILKFRLNSNNKLLYVS